MIPKPNLPHIDIRRFDSLSYPFVGDLSKGFGGFDCRTAGGMRASLANLLLSRPAEALYPCCKPQIAAIAEKRPTKLFVALNTSKLVPGDPCRLSPYKYLDL